MIRASLIVSGISEAATLAEGAIPRRGEAMSELSILSNATVAVDQGRFVYVGRTARSRTDLRLRSGGQRIDGGGLVALPGFVDAHTHLLFAGDRADEVGRKVRGASYGEIARSGGGLYSTVRATRAASDATLLQQSAGRLEALARSGVTCAEVKSGYALEHEGELRLLRLARRLGQKTRLPIVTTYMGAHAIPPEHLSDPDAYVSQMVRETIPAVRRERLAQFCDVFCEPGFFTIAQSRRILLAAAKVGLGLKIHADEFVVSGGARLAAELSATSAEHLLRTPSEDRAQLARAGVTGVLLPLTPTASMSGDRPPGRELIDAGVPVALGSDLSPNSWVESMPFVLSHAVYSGRLTPEEAVCAVTVNAAHAIGVSSEAGTLETGRRGDLVLFDAPSIAHVAYRFGTIPRRVYRQGIRVPSRELRP